ncbi:hypothetical protein FQA39_LY16566 [Lamprigera yunnana]|nr:hypothetical protein FQA39_LY16566 [Lamprigera yunnana]
MNTNLSLELRDDLNMQNACKRRSTCATSPEKDEVLIQKVVEKVLSNNMFIENLLSAMIDKVSKHFESVFKIYDEKVTKLQSELCATVDALELLDQHGKKNNLRFYGVPEHNNENITVTITTNCKQKHNIDITENDIHCSHRLYNKVGN